MSGPGDTDGPLRPATHRELGLVAARIREAVATSPFYGERFKAFEAGRFSPAYLEALSAVDPWHVALGVADGRPAALVVTVPEFGTIWPSWVYAFPDAPPAAGLAAIRSAIRHWDHGRFHKATCFVKPENRSARTIFRRVGFVEKALLERHILGEDMLLLERPLVKTVEGYDSGVDLSRVGRWRRAVRRLVRPG